MIFFEKRHAIEVIKVQSANTSENVTAGRNGYSVELLLVGSNTRILRWERSLDALLLGGRWWALDDIRELRALHVFMWRLLNAQ